MHEPPRRRTLLVLTVAAGLAIAGVGACVATDPAPAPREDDPHRHHGAAQVVFETALERADLGAEQLDRVRAIRGRLEADREARAAMKKRFRASMGAIVREGVTDDERFRRAVDEAARALEKRVQRSADAVVQLHALLTPAQRAAVAEGLRARIDRRYGAHHRQRHEGFEQLTADLALRPEQVEALKSVRDDLLGDARRLRPTPMELHDLVDAFEGERFAEALDAFHAEKVEIFRARLAAAGGHADRVLGLLDDGQRQVLADIVEHGRDAAVEPERRR